MTGGDDEHGHGDGADAADDVMLMMGDVGVVS